MKRNLLLVLSLFLLLGGLCVQAQSFTSMEIGYCGEPTFYTTPSPKVKMKMAILLPKAEMNKYLGNQLTKVMLATGTDLGSNTDIYLSYGLEEDPFYSQKITLTDKQSWSTIVLDIPYLIKEDKDVYIGFSLLTGNSGKCMSLDDGPNDPNGDYLAMFNTSTREYEWSHLSAMGFTARFCIKGVIEGNSLPQKALALQYISSDKDYLNLEENCNAEVVLKNVGAQTIKSFDAIYQFANEEPITRSFEDLNIANNTNYTFNIENLTVKSEGALPLKVSITNINGEGNNDASNNSLTKYILCSSNTTPRKVLMENFTTAKCPNCPLGHTLLEKVLEDNDSVIWVSHHGGYGTDNFTIPESLEYLWFYNGKSEMYAPAIMLDRVNMSDFGAKDANNKAAPGPIFTVTESAVEKAIKERMKTPAYVTVNIKESYNEESRKLSVTVSGKALVGNLPGNVHLNVFLTEDNLILSQAGAGTKYVHNNVMRAVLSGTWGEAVSFDSEGNYTVTYETNLDASWKLGDMKIVAFLNNYDYRYVNKCEVYNAEVFNLKNDPASITNSVIDSEVNVYSNGFSIVIDGDFAAASIFDASGKLVSSLNAQQRISTVDKGIYMVKIIEDDHTVVKKVIVD